MYGCSDGETGISMKDVVIFFTGAMSVPVLGWSTQPKLFSIRPTFTRRPQHVRALHLVLHPSTTTTMKNLNVSRYKVFETTEDLA